uniref:ABC transporter domain-containing protein n=1 Tax=Triticum urartu TaxID=4572 RepID=A0A8R7VBS6_TRIUA
MGSASDGSREHLLDVGGLAAGGPKIRVRGLRRRAEASGEEILRGVDLDVPRGVVMGVIGPSGSGKSTLLRALNRLWEPAPGAVTLDGADICGMDVLALRRKVGMLFQLPAMFDGARAMQTDHLFFPAGRQTTLIESYMCRTKFCFINYSTRDRGRQRAVRATAARQEAQRGGGEEPAEPVGPRPGAVLPAGVGAVRRAGAARGPGPHPRQRPGGAAAGRADERAGPDLDAEHRGGHRAAQDGEGAHHGDRLAQREADPADRRPGVPRRRRRGRGGARAVRPLRGQAPHGPALPGAQQLNIFVSLPKNIIARCRPTSA